ncbi:DNA polymerase III subunit beta [Acidithiobacillus sp. AMEEHan]|uniref:DNA polymerase III subunit beta n=1 Tax=Acidithiobacillus sp. AMEEHan TaxID=2994951 RepID=UPI0027E3E016|nr:DNA polymerase III subunit beta [Acidithiobacillus sp. AMEEHan]
MKLRVQKDEILPLLAATANIANRRPVQPILSHLLLRSTERGLQLIASDGEIQLRTELELKVEEGGQTAIPARKLYDICRTLVDGSEIFLHKDGERLTLRSGSARFTLPTLPAQDFPIMEERAARISGNCDGEDFQQALAAAATAMAHNDTRYFLNGVFVEIGEQKMRLVATDGHRLARVEIPFAHSSDAAPYQGILPRKTVLELLRIVGSGDVAWSFDEQGCRMQQEAQEFASRLVDANYPDYRRVIPVGQFTQCIIDRPTLKTALQQIDVIASDKNPVCTLQFQPENLVLRSRNEEQEEGEISVPAVLHGEATEIAFNTRYLLDAQNIFASDELLIQVRDSSSSALIRSQESDNPLYIVMPIRL